MSQNAIRAFVESVVLNPLLWCSWLEMVNLLQSNPSTNSASSANSQQNLSISPVEVFHILQQRFQQEYMNNNRNSNHIEIVYEVMRDLFRAKLQVEGSFSQTSAHTTLTTISDSETAPATISTFEQVSQDLNTLRNQYFPNSLYMLCELAMTYYHLQRFDKALECFSYIRKNDPYRYEHMHTYSNIFYIKGMKRELSVLAHELHRTQKFKPETCCILGNYYSMRGEHERAVSYFQRGLRLNPSFLSAWTLMGHEYVEMKNTTAAVSAYRTAVDIQPRDYRAWYGLGQTYEILNMPHYALYYYSKACALRPYDGRMWSALAGCYEQMEMISDALRCYQRSRDNGEQIRALVKMGELYRKINDNDQAAYYFTQCLQLQRNDTSGGPNNLMSEEMEAGILLFLTRYYMRESKPLNYELAHTYCQQLIHQFPSYSQKDLAQQMLRELSSIK
jgi:anaphase-promoting complex subunit 8